MIMIIMIMIMMIIIMIMIVIVIMILMNHIAYHVKSVTGYDLDQMKKCI